MGQAEEESSLVRPFYVSFGLKRLAVGFNLTSAAPEYS